MTTKPQIHQPRLSQPSLWRSRFTYTSAQKNLIMQNKPNFSNTKMNVCSVLKEVYKNIPLNNRRQNKPNQTQFFSSFFLPMLPIHPIQTQFQPTPAYPERSTAKSKGLSQPSSSQAGAQQFHNFDLLFYPLYAIHLFLCLVYFQQIRHNPYSKFYHKYLFTFNISSHPLPTSIKNMSSPDNPPLPITPPTQSPPTPSTLPFRSKLCCIHLPHPAYVQLFTCYASLSLPASLLRLTLPSLYFYCCF